MISLHLYNIVCGIYLAPLLETETLKCINAFLSVAQLSGFVINKDLSSYYMMERIIRLGPSPILYMLAFILLQILSMLSEEIR